MTRRTSFGLGWVVAGNWLLGLPPSFPTAVMAPAIQKPWYASWHARGTRVLFWDGPRNFEPPSPGFHATPAGGHCIWSATGPIHGGSSVESSFDPGTHRPQSRDLTTRPPRSCLRVGISLQKSHHEANTRELRTSSLSECLIYPTKRPL
ncbi:hypothetical protein AVEN_68367-1 [Araneus ventricosus]|uniref:Uncharacterized protein n=1 Tax=Araneus ventricosus TaxID=182803 RepID=A0A4Y2G199_ARAVE|nr:hypothetical protein AVEN_68367-1 [Araneus ventricosus]